jgi:hypothetical protein
MTKQITRTVLVGKNRRITLDELYLLSKREARLEVVVVVQPAAEESPHLTTTTTTTTTTPSSSSSTRRSSIEAALERLSLEEDDDAQSSSPPPPPMPLLSEGATIASLALLSLALAQGRIAVVVRDGGGDPGAPMLSAAIADLVDALVVVVDGGGGGGGSSSSPLRLPVDPAAYAKVVDGLLAPPARSEEDGDGVCDGGGGQTLPRLVDGPYLSRSISIARVSLMMARGE